MEYLEEKKTQVLFLWILLVLVLHSLGSLLQVSKASFKTHYQAPCRLNIAGDQMCKGSSDVYCNAELAALVAPWDTVCCANGCVTWVLSPSSEVAARRCFLRKIEIIRFYIWGWVPNQETRPWTSGIEEGDRKRVKREGEREKREVGWLPKYPWCAQTPEWQIPRMEVRRSKISTASELCVSGTHQGNA